MVPAAGVRNTLSLVSTLVILNLSGCDTLGQIKVSYPKVFSRERLVDSRYAETQWLQEQLDKVQSSSFQGGMDRRVLDVLIASVETNVKYGPPVEGADQAPQTTTIRPDKPILRAADSAVPKEPPKASGMEETGAELTSIERFNDKLAYGTRSMPPSARSCSTTRTTSWGRPYTISTST